MKKGLTKKFMAFIMAAFMTAGAIPSYAFAETYDESSEEANGINLTADDNLNTYKKLLVEKKETNDKDNLKQTNELYNYFKAIDGFEVAEEETEKAIYQEPTVPTMFILKDGKNASFEGTAVATEGELIQAIKTSDGTEENPIVVSLEKDIYLSSMLTVDEDKYVYINGNGYTVSRSTDNWDNNSQNILKVCGNLYIKNCVLDANGCKHVVLVSGGYFEAEDAEFTGAYNTNSYGAIGINNKGTMVMYDGAIYGNESKNSTAVVADGGTFEMTGTKIYNNVGHEDRLVFAIYDKTSAGGICGEITLNSGEIYNNKSIIDRTVSTGIRSDLDSAIVAKKEEKVSGSLYVHDNTVSVDGGTEMQRDYCVGSGNSGHRDSKGNYISSDGIQLTSPLTNDVVVAILEYNEGTIERRTLFRGADGYELTEDDLDKVDITIGTWFSNDKVYSKDDLCICLNKDENTIEACARAEITFIDGDNKKEAVLPKYIKSDLENTFTKDGYIFTGWNTKADGSGTFYKEDFVPTADMELFAQWKIVEGDCGKSDTDATGQAKDNLKYYLTLNDDQSTYTLHISGEGAMYNFGWNPIKKNSSYVKLWHIDGIVDKITSIVFEPKYEGAITSIGNSAFFGFTALSGTVEIPEGVETIGAGAFNGCSNVENIILPDSVKYIDSYAFEKCSADIYPLKASIELADAPFSYTAIKKIVYSEKLNLTKSYGVWPNNKSAKELVIGPNIREIDAYNFTGCPIEKITLDENNTYFKCEDDVLYSADGKTLYTIAFEKTGSYSIAEGVETLAKDACRENSLTELNIPEGVKTIGAGAFNAMKNVKQLILPSTLTEVANNSFANSLSLIAIDFSRAEQSITFPTGIWMGDANNSPERRVIYIGDKQTDTSRIFSGSPRERLIVAQTNGGTFPDDTVFTAASLADPVKEGYTFDGWYDNAEFTGGTVSVPSTGKIYYAKWMPEKSEKIETLKVNGVTLIEEYLLTGNTVEGVTYNNGTLTLDDAVINSSSSVIENNKENTAAIYADGDLKLELKGDNKIELTSNRGIHTTGDLLVQGDGNLTVIGTGRPFYAEGSIVFDGTGIYTADGDCEVIYAKKNITFNEGKFELKANNARWAQAILTGSGNLNINGGDISVTAPSDDSASYVYSVYINGDVNISGGTLYTSSKQDGIYCAGECNISNGSVNAVQGIRAQNPNKNTIITGGEITVGGKGIEDTTKAYLLGGKIIFNQGKIYSPNYTVIGRNADIVMGKDMTEIGITTSNAIINQTEGKYTVYNTGNKGMVYTAADTDSFAFYEGKIGNKTYVKGITAFTNGGMVDENAVITNSAFLEPEKEGNFFGGWYADPEFSESPVTVPEAGKTYYAKWIPAGSLTATAEGFEGDYDGKLHSITVTLNDEEAEISYSVDGGITYSPVQPVFKNAGEYVVYYKVRKEGCFDFIDKATVKINKIDNPVSITANKTRLYGGGTVELKVTVPDYCKGTTINGITCSDESIVITGGENGIYTAKLPSKVYEYTFKVDASGEWIYNSNNDASVTVAVKKKSSTSDSSAGGASTTVTKETKPEEISTVTPNIDGDADFTPASKAEISVLEETLNKNKAKLVAPLGSVESEAKGIITITVPVSEEMMKKVEDEADLTLVKINADGTITYFGGNLNEDKDKFTAIVDENGLFVLAVKDNLLCIDLRIGEKDCVINNVVKTCDVAPVIINDRTMVPLRFVAENLGADVMWNDADKTVTIHMDGNVITMTIGQEIPGFGASPVIIDDRTMVPISYIASSFGANVIWAAETKDVKIIK